MMIPNAEYVSTYRVLRNVGRFTHFVHPSYPDIIVIYDPWTVTFTKWLKVDNPPER